MRVIGIGIATSYDTIGSFHEACGEIHSCPDFRGSLMHFFVFMSNQHSGIYFESRVSHVGVLLIGDTGDPSNGKQLLFSVQQLKLAG
jgi:hypothetical protein